MPQAGLVLLPPPTECRTLEVCLCTTTPASLLPLKYVCIYLCVCVFVPVWAYVMCLGMHRRQKRTSASLEKELETLEGGGIRLVTWMLDLNSGLHCSKPPGPSHPTPTPTLPAFVMNEELIQILFGLLASASQVNEVFHSNL